jgi:tRNA wybutosine-synthesizing protein 1
MPKGWKELNETLSLLPSFKYSTVIRITSARGLNMNNTEGYRHLIEKAAPTYVEVKAHIM